MPRLADRPNYAQRWTEDQSEQLTALLGAGRSMRDIPEALGRSQEAVRNRAWKMGLLKRQLPRL